MKRILFIIFSFTSTFPLVYGFTGGSNNNIAENTFKFDVGTIFPTPRKLPSDGGVDNLIDYIITMIPLLTTLMAVGAVLMVIL